MALVRSDKASSSSSSSSSSTYTPLSSSSSYTYDVFLSFRGKDTRMNFTDHLYNALVDDGIRTFRDEDDMERGKSLKPELEKAIQESRIAIIVLSKDYASSTWCLDELVMILQQSRVDSKRVVLPVFYDITPSEIRNQTGRTGEAFDRHKQKLEFMGKVERWRAALQEVSRLTGMELENEADRHEGKFIKKIIKEIREKLRRTPLFVAKILIGMHSRTKSINKWLQDGSSEVSVIGICGIGGIGKTTIAKYVYNQNYESFEGSCFLADIREKSGNPEGLARLQRQLLSSISNTKKEKIYNVDEGIQKIKEAVSRKRVLLVLDDVDKKYQLDALLGMPDWFHRGSKIIITTRDEGLVKLDEVFTVEELSHDESVELFTFHAFPKDRCTKDHREHIERIVDICGGLPLALQVIGSSLSRTTVHQWANEVRKLQAIPPNDVLSILKISYYCLEDDHDKRLFLDIACFFVGKEKDITVKVLDNNIDTHADVRVQNLIDRNLLTIDSRGKLRMHQLIQNMGRNIVIQESLDPERRTRLWRQVESYDVLREKIGTEITEGLILDMRMLVEDGNITRKRRYEEALDHESHLTGIRSFFRRFGFFSSHLRTEAFERMGKLRLLKLNYTELAGHYNNFPKNLAWLCWHGFPLKYMPTELSLEKLVALDLRHSQLEEVWTGPKFLGSLRILNLSYSKRLTKTPNFLGLQKLERLILKGCVSLIEIDETIEFLEKIDLLDLTDCKNLRKLPRNLNKMESLETLTISGCSTLFGVGLDDNGEGKWWRTLPLFTWVLRPMKGLENLILPCSLRRLSLLKCNLSNDSLPFAFSNLSLLEDLDLSENLFRSLPDCVTSLSSLRNLSIRSCKSINSAFGLPSNLKMLNCDSCRSLRKIAFQSAPHKLDEIITWECRNLVEIEGILKREPIAKVDRRIIMNLGVDIESVENLEVFHRGLWSRGPVQGFYEFGIFSTYIPGGEIPSCFSERKKGSSMSFTVPLVPNFRILCLNICVVYANSNRYVWTYPPAIKISNKTKDLTWVYNPVYVGTNSDEDMMRWFSQWNFGNQLEGGDELVVSVFMCGPFEVKECGIKIVYREEEEEDNGVVVDDNNNKTYNFHWNEVLGADLSRIRLSTGAYYLTRRLHGTPFNYWSKEGIQRVFGDMVDIEEILNRNVCCRVIDGFNP